MPSEHIGFGYGVFPIGAVIAFLLVALRAALDARQHPLTGKRLRRAWMLWLLGPATVVCLLCAALILRAIATP